MQLGSLDEFRRLYQLWWGMNRVFVFQRQLQEVVKHPLGAGFSKKVEFSEACQSYHGSCWNQKFKCNSALWTCLGLCTNFGGV